MSKSAGNGFLPGELFTGNHPLLAKGYDPMAVRFFMLQTHYRSTLDFSNDVLQASEKGFERLMESYLTLQTLQPSQDSSEDIAALRNKCYEAMNDDFNTSVLIAHLFEAVRIINSANDKKTQLTQQDLDSLKLLYRHFVFDVMGLRLEESNNKLASALDKVMSLLLEMRAKAKLEKNFKLSDEIRDQLIASGFQIKDSKEGSTWKI